MTYPKTTIDPHGGYIITRYSPKWWDVWIKRISIGSVGIIQDRTQKEELSKLAKEDNPQQEKVQKYEK